MINEHDMWPYSGYTDDYYNNKKNLINNLKKE